jgi:hypothetical protein
MHFFIFLRFSRDFARIIKVTILLKLLFFNETPGCFPGLTHMPLDCTKLPGKTQSLAMRPLAKGAVRLRPILANRRRSRPGKWSGSTISSPRTQGWPKLGRGNRRRGCTARAGGGGRGGSAPATVRAQPRQQAAREGPMGSREGAWVVARPWEAEGVQLDGGGADGAVGWRCRREKGQSVRHL